MRWVTRALDCKRAIARPAAGRTPTFCQNASGTPAGDSGSRASATRTASIAACSNGRATSSSVSDSSRAEVLVSACNKRFRDAVFVYTARAPDGIVVVTIDGMVCANSDAENQSK